MQSMGIDFNSQEFRYLWSILKKPVKKMGARALMEDMKPENARSSSTSSKKKNSDEDLYYFELLKGFN
jgi:hypothetical protein